MRSIYILVLLFYSLACQRPYRYEYIYEYKNDDSNSRQLSETRIYNKDDKLLFVFTKDSSLFVQRYYDDTLLIKEVEYGPWFDSSNRDTIITWYNYNPLCQLQLKKSHSFNGIFPAGYGITGPKGCLMPMSEVKREWQNHFNCNYYKYDNRGNLIYDSSYSVPILDTAKTRYYSLTNYQYDARNLLTMVTTHEFHFDKNTSHRQLLKNDTVSYQHFATGYVRNDGERTDSSFFVNKQLASERHTIAGDGYVSTWVDIYRRSPNGKIINEQRTYTWRGEYSTMAEKTTRVYENKP